MAKSTEWSKGDRITAARLNDMRTDALAVSGTYTGDGTESKAVTGLGFEPAYVRIWTRETVSGTAIDVYETSSRQVDDNGDGGATHYPSGGGAPEFVSDAILSFDSDGFTVDDAGSDSHPNKDGQIYNFVAFSGEAI